MVGATVTALKVSRFRVFVGPLTPAGEAPPRGSLWPFDGEPDFRGVSQLAAGGSWLEARGRRNRRIGSCRELGGAGVCRREARISATGRC